VPPRSPEPGRHAVAVRTRYTPGAVLAAAAVPYPRLRQVEAPTRASTMRDGRWWVFRRCVDASRRSVPPAPALDRRSAELPEKAPSFDGRLGLPQAWARARAEYQKGSHFGRRGSGRAVRAWHHRRRRVLLRQFTFGGVRRLILPRRSSCAPSCARSGSGLCNTTGWTRMPLRMSAAFDHDLRQQDRFHSAKIAGWRSGGHRSGRPIG